MQDFKFFHEAKFHILQVAEKKLNRQDFCKLHKMSEAKLSRILRCEQEVGFEMLDYICQELQINTTVYVN